LGAESSAVDLAAVLVARSRDANRDPRKLLPTPPAVIGRFMRRLIALGTGTLSRRKDIEMMAAVSIDPDASVGVSLVP